MNLSQAYVQTETKHVSEGRLDRAVMDAVEGGVWGKAWNVSTEVLYGTWGFTYSSFRNPTSVEIYTVVASAEIPEGKRELQKHGPSCYSSSGCDHHMVDNFE